MNEFIEEVITDKEKIEVLFYKQSKLKKFLNNYLKIIID